MSLIILPLLAFILSLTGCYLLIHPRTRLAILDVPNERSLHERPKPRTGGLAVGVAIVIAVGLASLSWPMPAVLSWIAAAALLVAGVSFVDDCRSLPAKWRFIVHVVAAAMLLFGPPSLSIWSGSTAFGGSIFALLALLGVVWAINLYNFMDGMDGLAAGMAVSGFTGLAVLTAQAGAFGLALVALVVAAAAGGFLVWNFPPARLFLGDSGSSTLGFLVAALAFWGQGHGVPLWQPLVLFSPFIVDASWTLLKRLWRGERIWQAHKQHAYQRLVEAGWGHRRTVLAAYGLMAVCLVLVLACALLPQGWLPGDGAIIVLPLVGVGYIWLLWRLEHIVVR